VRLSTSAVDVSGTAMSDHNPKHLQAEADDHAKFVVTGAG
jgi:hypothetical protein